MEAQVLFLLKILVSVYPIQLLHLDLAQEQQLMQLPCQVGVLVMQLVQVLVLLCQVGVSLVLLVLLVLLLSTAQWACGRGILLPRRCGSSSTSSSWHRRGACPAGKGQAGTRIRPGKRHGPGRGPCRPIDARNAQARMHLLVPAPAGDNPIRHHRRTHQG